MRESYAAGRIPAHRDGYLQGLEDAARVARDYKLEYPGKFASGLTLREWIADAILALANGEKSEVAKLKDDISILMEKQQRMVPRADYDADVAKLREELSQSRYETTVADATAFGLREGFDRLTAENSALRRELSREQINGAVLIAEAKELRKALQSCKTQSDVDAARLEGAEEMREAVFCKLEQERESATVIAVRTKLFNLMVAVRALSLEEENNLAEEETKGVE
jgi:hypothetical protein